MRFKHPRRLGAAYFFASLLALTIVIYVAVSAAITADTMQSASTATSFR